jgi:hypothetical protein
MMSDEQKNRLKIYVDVYSKNNNDLLQSDQITSDLLDFYEYVTKRKFTSCNKCKSSAATFVQMIGFAVRELKNYIN